MVLELTVLFLAVVGEPQRYIVREGQAEAVIVDGGTPEGCTSAAQELAHYLQRLSGAKIPVQKEPAPGRVNLYLGGRRAFAQAGTTPEALNLGRDGFLLRTVEDGLVLAGGRNLSTLYAVYSFLEDLGCRWYFPGELGEVVPHRRTIPLPEVNRVERPAFRLRWIGRGEWGRRNRQNVGTGEPDEFQVKWFVHTYQQLVPGRKLFKAHPEYFALVGSARRDPRRPGRVNLCTSNPEVVAQAAATICRLKEENPNLAMISVDPEDTQVFCQCEACRALDQPDAPYQRRASNRVFTFTNQVADLVAERYPDLILKTIAYHSYVRPPADPNWRPRPNVAIQFCRFECHNHGLQDPTCPVNQGFNAWLEEWLERTPKVLLYEYYWKVSWVGLPWPIQRSLTADFPRYQRDGLFGLASQWSTNFATNGLGYYLAAKLTWNPQAEVEALVDDYCRGLFAEAAEPMRAYFADLERAAQESGLHLAFQRPYREIVALFTDEVLARLEGHIARAEQLARSDLVRRRVAMMRAAVDYTRLVRDYLRAVLKSPALRKIRWAGQTRSPEAEAALEETRGKAEEIRQFLARPENADALDQVNNYTELLLNPEYVLRAVRRRGTYTKAHWQRERGQAPALRLRPRTVALWLYGNDFDFVEGRPEHSVAVRNRMGEWLPVGTIGTAEHPGDGRNLCYVLSGLRWADFPEEWEVRIENPPGGPYASTLYGIWIMPEGAVPVPEATRRVETELEAVREAAYGFTEFDYRGILCGEEKPCLVRVALQ
ncbi:MAG TPA: DUF4838 domain-containing protein [Armatimonadetes bacterium]|nr:DUF4838 domain-containing protein [Armatimonadota bacterium]